jgi:D-alanyl-lipoteichoic acid acyltransferase DltB (MBOAT superfamily)
MLFNTLDFVVFFIIALTIIAIIKKRNFQHIFIILASYFFLYYSSSYQITLLIFTTLWTFYLAREIHLTSNIVRKKQFLVLTLGGNLGLLGFFKYAGFTISELNGMLNHFGITNIPELNLILPIGISFYTFHAIGYVIDVYRGNTQPSKSLKEYMLFVTFFPQLVAGPILRAGQFLPQLREKVDNLKERTKLRLIVIESHNLKLGLTMMIFGFMKKMLFADNIAPMVNHIFANPVGAESFTIILGAVAFAVQIYGDFSGYSDIAIGAALIMGFKIPQNFNKPYFALSPADFWRRWHISLSTWVRDYLYFPLVFNNRKSDLRVFISLMTSFFFLGLWHGAGLNFAIYGILHGSYVSIETVLRKHSKFLRENTFFKSKIGKMISILVTQYLVFFAFIAFRIQDLDQMFYTMKKYVILDFAFSQTLYMIKSFELPIILMTTFIILHYISYKKHNVLESIANLKLSKWFLFSTLCILLIVLFYGGNAKEFIYFEF